MKFIDWNDVKGNEALITPFALIHLLLSALLFKYLQFFFNDAWSILLTFIIHTIYELKDYYVSYIKKRQFNSVINSLGDTLFCLIGIFICLITPINIEVLFILVLLSVFIIFFFNLEPSDKKNNIQLK